MSSYRLEIAGVGADTVTLTVECSAGFYIRSLAHDLGERLGIGAHLTALRRGRVGDFGVDQAISLETAEREPQAALSALVPLADMLPQFPAVVLTADGVSRAVHGREIGPGDIDHGLGAGESGRAGNGERGLDAPIRMMDKAGRLVAIGRRAAAAGLLHPSVVLV